MEIHTQCKKPGSEEFDREVPLSSEGDYRPHEEEDTKPDTPGTESRKPRGIGHFNRFDVLE